MFFGRKKNAMEATTLFYRQMASLLAAGVSTQDALIALSEENESHKIKQLVSSIRNDISTGNNPGDSLKNYPDFIKKTLRYFVASDNHGESFPKILNAIADDNEKMDDLKKRVKSALVYPASIISIACILTGIILVFVIPTFVDMFASFGSSLPAPTRLVINISNFAIEHMSSILLFFILVGLVLKSNKTLFHNILNFLPGISSLTRSLSIVRFLKYLSLLLTLNAPLETAIEYAAGSVNNVVYAKKFKALKNEVASGNPLSDILNSTGLFTPMIIRMIKAGEKIDATENIISEVAGYYEHKLGSIEKNIQVIDIAIIIFLGTAIGGLVISMYLPIFQMAGAVGG